MPVVPSKQCAGSATHPGNNDVLMIAENDLAGLPFPKDVANPIGWAALPLGEGQASGVPVRVCA